jgi:peptidyl-tRNA hydrolase
LIQAGHAFAERLAQAPDELRQAYAASALDRKIALAVKNDVELGVWIAKFEKAGIPCHVVTDAGLTVFDGPTRTSVGIGPLTSAESNMLNLRSLPKYGVFGIGFSFWNNANQSRRQYGMERGTRNRRRAPLTVKPNPPPWTGTVLISFPPREPNDCEADDGGGGAVIGPNDLIIHHGIARPRKISCPLSNPMKSQHKYEQTNDQQREFHINSFPNRFFTAKSARPFLNRP